ncbi:MAG: 50S ribosomal protein L9 [Acidimicrobiales bacterium]
MKVILRTDVTELGRRGDVLEVADGYARNYLLPQGLVMRANPGAIEQAASMRRAREAREVAERAQAEDLARRLAPTVIRIVARAGPGGRLFGSVTAADIAAAVMDQTGVAIDRRKVALDTPIRELGTHQVPVRLHADVELPATVEITAG